MPTHNRGRSIRATIESLLAQETGSAFEIIVVDNASTDDTPSVVAEFVERHAPRVRYAFEPVVGSSSARNAGIPTAAGRIVVFVDDDIIAMPGWLRALGDAFKAHPDAWCVGGKVELSLPAVLPPWFNGAESSIIATYLSRQDYGDETIRLDGSGLISANLAVTRDALRRLGGFDTSLGRFGQQLMGGEDLDLVRRIRRVGGGVYYCGAAQVLHLTPASRLTKRHLRNRAYWEGRTKGRTAVRRNAVKRPWDLGREGFMMTKEWLMLWPSLAFGDVRRSFELELSALKRLGYLRESLGRRR